MNITRKPTVRNQQFPLLSILFFISSVTCAVYINVISQQVTIFCGGNAQILQDHKNSFLPILQS